MIKIAITGGIATGKSTIANMLYDKGAHVQKADDIGRQLLTIPNIEYFKVVAEFGREILDNDNSQRDQWVINRKKLAKIVFEKDKHKLVKLEEIIHPGVENSIKSSIALLELSSRNTAFVFESALLYQSGMEKYFDHVLVARCDRDKQLSRTAIRDDATYQETEQRMINQLDYECVHTRSFMDEVSKYTFIDTNSWNTVQEQIDEFWSKITNEN